MKKTLVKFSFNLLGKYPKTQFFRVPVTLLNIFFFWHLWIYFVLYCITGNFSILWDITNFRVFFAANFLFCVISRIFIALLFVFGIKKMPDYAYTYIVIMVNVMITNFFSTFFHFYSPLTQVIRVENKYFYVGIYGIHALESSFLLLSDVVTLIHHYSSM